MSRPNTCTLKTAITQMTCQQKTQDPDPRRMVPRLQHQIHPAFPVIVSGKKYVLKTGKNRQWAASWLIICGEQNKQDSEVKNAN